VGIFGPPDTLYEGGYFKADMEFPTTYPFAPPKVYKNKIIRGKKTLKRRLSRK
jgi:ubiquitin-protein ligase